MLDYIADDSTCVPYTVETHPRHSKKKTKSGLGRGNRDAHRSVFSLETLSLKQYQ